MQLYFIRHGQSTNNVSWEYRDLEGYDRVSDPPLTELGVRQAQTLADFIASSQVDPNQSHSVGAYRHRVSITHLYSSLMIRAIHTGTILSETLGIPLYGLLEAHEIGGIYLETLVDGKTQISFEHGVTPAYLQQSFPDFRLHQPIEERGWWQGGMETVTSPLMRANSVLRLVKERHLDTNDKVAIVTHGGFFNTMARTIFNVSLDEPDNTKLPTWFSFCNCAISRVDFVEGRAVWVYHNRTDFMEDDLVTC
jgi:2,3-bisphosphoglycerate-dependent phosphoglycerate mutase